jgi:hypothetical protein
VIKTSTSTAERFHWRACDVTVDLPDNWRAEIGRVAKRRACERVLVPSSVTSREAETVAGVPAITVTGDAIAAELPWLLEFYRGLFREIAELTFTTGVETSTDVRSAINLNVQRGASMHAEAHVDSNPVGALLYVTSHAPGEGGELVVSNRGDVVGISEIERDATRIYPIAGHLVLFDAHAHSHYVAPLRDPHGERIVVAMNYYTAAVPQSLRPADLDAHLFGTTDNKEIAA